MLNKYDKENIEIIKSTAQTVFGKNHVFGELQLLDRPFTEFYLPMKLYGTFDVRLNYDRSTLSIGFPTEEGYVVLSRVAGEHVFRGFDGMKPENILHNFQVLDRLIKNMK